MSSSQGRLPVYDYPIRVSRDPAPAPRSGVERVEAPRVVVRPRSPPRRRPEDDFPVRPRIRTNSLDPGGPSSRRPLSMIDPRPPNKMSGPLITRGIERPPSPVSKTGGAQLEASYIIPASSSSGRHHHRQSSLTTGDKFPVRERDRERIYPGGRSARDMAPPAPRPRRDERDYAYEYTSPQEEVLRDLAPPPQRRPRRDSYASSARPTSMISLDRPDKVYPRAEKDALPAASSRALEDIARRDSLRTVGRAGGGDLDRRDSASRGHIRGDRVDAGRYRDIPRPVAEPREEYVPYPSENKRDRPRKPTLEDERPPPKARVPVDDRYDRDEDRHRKHHHHPRELDARMDYDGEEDREREPERRRDYDDKGRRVREETRERHDRGEDIGSHDGVLAAGGAATVAGIAAAEGSRRHRHKDDDPRGRKDPQAHPAFTTEKNTTIGASEDEGREERRRRRRREREREDREYREANQESERLRLEAPSAPGNEPQSLREQKSYERRPYGEDQPHRPRGRQHQHRRHRSRTQDVDSFTESSDSDSDSDSSNDRHGRVLPRVVTPSNDSSELSNTAMALSKPAPKGILKPPREKFPEEPSTIREGIAPLDAAKKGIPPEARWTRINRRLVNPEALEQESVRFEEFPDHVIVLKVLNQEEIARFTQRTHEIRERRRLIQGSEGSGSVGVGSGDGGGPV